jgi:hypothetical protein
MRVLPQAAARQLAESLVTVLQLVISAGDLLATLRSAFPTLKLLFDALEAAARADGSTQDALPPRDVPVLASALARSLSALASATPAMRTRALSASALALSAATARRVAADGRAGRPRGTTGVELRSLTGLTSPPVETRGGVKGYVIFVRELRAQSSRPLSRSTIKAKWHATTDKQKAEFNARAASEVQKKRAADRAARAAMAPTAAASESPVITVARPQLLSFVGAAGTRGAATATPGAVTALLGIRRARRTRA